MRLVLVCLLLLDLAPTALAAQSAPPRPALEEGADTLDAYVYYGAGIRALESDPAYADAAFYWAARLDPTWADPLYARRVAMLMERPPLLRSLMQGTRAAKRSELMPQLDSLAQRALLLNPYLDRALDRKLLSAYFVREVQLEASKQGEYARSNDVEEYLQQSLRRASPDLKAWALAADRRYPAALETYAEALRKARYPAPIEAERGRIFFRLGNADSALACMSRAVAAMRQNDERQLVFIYEPKASYEYAVGTALESREDLAGAREAYARALAEDMSFDPAYRRTGWLALAAGDTAGAVSALSMAVQVRGDDVLNRYQYGLILIAARRTQDAAGELRRALALDPDYADPYLALGRVEEALGRREAAVAAYRDYLARAPRKEQRRAIAESHLATLAPVEGAKP